MIKKYVLIAYLLISLSTSGLIINEISREDINDKYVQNETQNEVMNLPFTDEFGDNCSYTLFDNYTFAYSKYGNSSMFSISKEEFNKIKSDASNNNSNKWSKNNQKNIEYVEDSVKQLRFLDDQVYDNIVCALDFIRTGKIKVLEMYSMNWGLIRGTEDYKAGDYYTLYSDGQCVSYTLYNLTGKTNEQNFMLSDSDFKKVCEIMEAYGDKLRRNGADGTGWSIKYYGIDGKSYKNSIGYIGKDVEEAVRIMSSYE